MRRAIGAGVLHGEETDLAHVLVALVQGLVAAENTERLGSSQQSIDRRWRLALDAALRGLGSPRPWAPPAVPCVEAQSRDGRPGGRPSLALFSWPQV